MKGLTTVSKKSQNGKTSLYYNVRENKVYTEAGENRFLLTILLQPHTPKQVEETVKYFMDRY